MGTFSIWHWLIVLAVVLLLFGGRGKISQLMGDFGKGLNAFRKGMKEESNSDDAVSREEPKKLGVEAERSAEPAREADRAAKS